MAPGRGSEALLRSIQRAKEVTKSREMLRTTESGDAASLDDRLKRVEGDLQRIKKQSGLQRAGVFVAIAVGSTSLSGSIAGWWPNGWWPKSPSFYDATAKVCSTHYSAMQDADKMTGPFLDVLKKKLEIENTTVRALKDQQRRVPIEDVVNFGYYVRHKEAIRKIRARLVDARTNGRPLKSENARLDRQQKLAVQAAIGVTGLPTCGDEDPRLE